MTAMRSCASGFLLTVLVGLLASCDGSPSEPIADADLLITGGTVLTMAGAIIDNGAVAVRDGRIIAVGPAAAVAGALRARETIDARGMAVLPGLVNAHAHVPMTLFRGIADDRHLVDWLQNFIFPAEFRFVDAAFVRWGTRLAAAEMILSGTTTFADMYFFEAEVAREARTAGLRGVLGHALLDFPAPDNPNWEAAIASARAFVAAFRGDPLITPTLAPHASYTVSREHLQQVRSLATELGVPIQIHLSQTQEELRQVAAFADGLTPGDYLAAIGFLGRDVIAADGVWLTPAEIRTFAARGVGVVHNPRSNMMLAAGVAPVPAMRAAGVSVGLGTDGPAGSNNNLDLLSEMGSAARLHKVAQLDPTSLGARAVLEMATIGGARALGLADRIGSLEVGKRADLILLDLQRPHIQPVYSVESAIVYAANAADVVLTIVEGRVLMRDRRLLTIDLEPTLARAREYRARIAAALGVPAALFSSTVRELREPGGANPLGTFELHPEASHALPSR